LLSRRVYEPAQYDKTKPANLLLCFDGGGAVLQQQENGPTGGDPTLLDNLHAKGAIPVTIVVGITPGRNPDYPEQRSHEYDTVRLFTSAAMVQVAHRRKRRCHRSLRARLQPPAAYLQVSDVNATFLATEVLPIVEKQWNISSDP
jgi:enterochelin esterase-like enzyme